MKDPKDDDDAAAIRAKVGKMRDAASSYEEHNAVPFRVVKDFGARGYAAYSGSYSSDDGEVERFFDLADLEASSPFYALRTIGNARDVVTKTFAPLAKKIPLFVKALASLCRYVIALERTSSTPGKNGWFLLYFADRGTKIPSGAGRYTHIAGRAPMRNPRLNRIARAKGFTLPPSLRALYSVHNGLGFSSDHTMGVEALVSAKMLRPLPAVPELLEFYCDSGGNRKSFGRGGDDVSDWDRSTHERANEGSLWTFIDRDLLRYVTGAD